MPRGKRLSKTPSQPIQNGVSEVSVAAVVEKTEDSVEPKKTRKPSGPRVWKPVQIVVRVENGTASVALAIPRSSF